MFKVISTVILQLSAYASILGLYFTVKPFADTRPAWEWFLLAFTAILAAFLLIREIRDQLSIRKRTFSDERGIKEYMCKWISSPGRTIVFSRDLSWGDEFITKKILLQKSKKNELTIFLEKPTSLSEELRSYGANIRVYGESGFIPESRFTIVGSDKQGARVAVGLLENGKHVVYQFESGQHPIFSLANDLTKLADRVGI